jgi:hypothetical protein
MREKDPRGNILYLPSAHVEGAHLRFESTTDFRSYAIDTQRYQTPASVDFVPVDDRSTP